jgi:pimeloyl-ACP methyl ester carboxylesterase
LIKKERLRLKLLLPHTRWPHLPRHRPTLELACRTLAARTVRALTLARSHSQRSNGAFYGSEAGRRACPRCENHIGYAVEAGAASDTEPEVHEDYVSAYDLGRFADSARFVRHYPEQNPVLRDLLPSITVPTQIVAGRDDELVPWSNNEYLHDLLPNSEIHPLDAGHFAWEQAAEEYGRLVTDWVSGGYRRVRHG